MIAKRGRGKSLSIKDDRVRKPAPKGQRIAKFLYDAQQPHPFKGDGTQCQTCWGWYDDSRHVGEARRGTESV